MCIYTRCKHSKVPPSILYHDVSCIFLQYVLYPTFCVIGDMAINHRYLSSNQYNQHVYMYELSMGNHICHISQTYECVIINKISWQSHCFSIDNRLKFSIWYIYIYILYIYIPLSDKPILLSYYLLIGIHKSGLLRKNTLYNLKKCKFLFHDFPCQPAFQRGFFWSPPLQFIQLHRASGYDLWPYNGWRSWKRNSCRFAVDCCGKPLENHRKMVV